MRQRRPKRQQRARLGIAYSGLLTLLLLGLGACSTQPVQSTPFSFSNPPIAGDQLPSDQRFFVCNDIDGARYMASTGFLIASCWRLTETESSKLTVKSLKLVELPEGSMWEVELIGPDGRLWMPLPWHDWA